MTVIFVKGVVTYDPELGLYRVSCRSLGCSEELRLGAAPSVRDAPGILLKSKWTMQLCTGYWFCPQH